MKKIIASIAAAGILVVGAFAASTITSSEASAQTDEAPAATDEVRRPNPGAILDQVLGDLVEDGTLEQSQADAVKNGLESKRDELKERFGDRKDRRAHRQEMRENIEAWLEDGVITADELAELEVDLPIHEDGPLAEALKDGQITQAEWDTFLEERKANHGARSGAPSDSAIG
jgi:crotonobetainyl-CoA:carnitine CoA-transferase CaiB-like acyl-CoA transferase